MYRHTLKIFILVCTVWAISCEFLPQRLAVVDIHKQNFLIRGNLPMKDEKFQMSELKKGLQNLTSLKPKSYRLVVYSLMNSLTAKETKSKYIEEKYFLKHPEYTYKSNMVLGSFIDPEEVPQFLRRLVLPIYEYLSIDGMSTMLQEFRSYLKEDDDDIPTIVYFHCSQGVDRTGYVSSVYGMRYQNKTIKQAYKENLAVLNDFRDYMHWNTYNGMRWFCLYFGRSTKECLEDLQ